MVRVLLSLSFVVVLLGVFPALAHESHDHEAGIVVVDIEGVLDQRTIDFVSATVRKREAALLVFRIDSPGIASGEIGPLLDLVQASATPIVTWIGPQGAQAYGGALQIAAATDYLGAAPGTSIGFAQPVVAGEAPSGFLVDAPGLESLARIRVQISQESGLPAFVDATSPSIGQFIASLNGLEIDGFVLETAEQITLADGTIATVLSEEVHFLKPGLITRILRHQPPAHGELQDGLAQRGHITGVGEQLVHLRTHPRPRRLDRCGILGIGKGGERGVPKRRPGAVPCLPCGLQTVQQPHQRVHLRHDAVLFGEGGEPQGHLLH